MFPVTEYGDKPAISVTAGKGDDLWHVPEEMPVAFIFNRANYAVMMATPDNMHQFALGFALSEKIVSSASEVKALDVQYSDKGVDLKFKISEQAQERLAIKQKRNLVGSSSCGVCGVESAEVLFRPLPKVSENPIELHGKSMQRALDTLAAHQPLKSLTRSVHGAAWVSLTGDIETVLEDVGRHNALDKLLGHLALHETDMRAGYVLMSSRCSYEIVQKAASCGVQAILSVSAPTAFALRKAREANMSLYCQHEGGALRLA